MRIVVNGGDGVVGGGTIEALHLSNKLVGEPSFDYPILTLIFRYVSFIPSISILYGIPDRD